MAKSTQVQEVTRALANRGKLAMKGVAAVAATAIAQTAVLAGTYASPPDAHGPREGSVVYCTSSDVQDTAPMRARRKGRLDEAPQSCSVFVLGDSLVTGVGCNASDIGPTMPKRIAESLAQQLRTDVRWHAAGQTGATVAEIREHCLPKLREHVQNGNRVDAVLFFCGVNDFKRLINPWSGASPRKFREELEHVAHEIHAIAGPCYIAFPQLPIECVDRFWGPLGVLVRYVARLWDEQKRAVVASIGSNALFVEKPQLKGLGAFKFTSAADGVHPSSEGYNLWGEWCGTFLAPYLSKSLHTPTKAAES